MADGISNTTGGTLFEAGKKTVQQMANAGAQQVGVKPLFQSVKNTQNPPKLPSNFSNFNNLNNLGGGFPFEKMGSNNANALLKQQQAQQQQLQQQQQLAQMKAKLEAEDQEQIRQKEEELKKLQELHYKVYGKDIVTPEEAATSLARQRQQREEASAQEEKVKQEQFARQQQSGPVAPGSFEAGSMSTVGAPSNSPSKASTHEIGKTTG
ncbi:MAG TPA: hypothetical protein VGT05_03445 [Patescibacteria group bacterium]|nr:hypothetical protein [Patescibacteria group bacterium]